MKGFLIILIILSPFHSVAIEISKENYFLGFSSDNEKEFGIPSNIHISDMLLYAIISDKEKDKLTYLYSKTGIKFKRTRAVKDCSNCHNWFISKKVNKDWKLEKYYSFEPIRYDSIEEIQWYKPKFRASVLLDATPDEKISFFKGLYLKSGEFDSLYMSMSITIDESLTKAQTVKELIMSYKFYNIEFTLRQPYELNMILMDNRVTIAFSPSEEFLKLMEPEILINNKILEEQYLKEKESK